MTDRLRVDPTGAGRIAGTTASPDSGRGRTVLWIVLVVSATGNAVFSIGQINALVSLGFGLVTVLCIGLLLRRHLRRRRG